jgi:hypothetical protein
MRVVSPSARKLRGLACLKQPERLHSRKDEAPELCFLIFSRPANNTSEAAAETVRVELHRDHRPLFATIIRQNLQ